MKSTVILAHPYEKSFNHAIFATVCRALADQNVAFFAHDLYAENFSPILTKEELDADRSTDPLVNQYADEMTQSDLLFFIHPNWWGQPPAIMKGYIDRIFRPPHAYDFPQDASGGGRPITKLNGKVGIVFNTSNTEEERENAVFGDPLENIWKRCVFEFCGIERSYRKMFRIIADSDPLLRKQWLDEVADIVKGAILKICVP